jgi:putative FmdB family regulatory protein
MPIYEYQCAKCGQRIERLQSVNDPPPKSCEACGGAMTRLVSAPAFQFKGSGWYVTDYGGRKGSAEGGSDAAGSAETSEKTSDRSSAEAGSDKTGGKKGADKTGAAKKAATTGPAKTDD